MKNFNSLHILCIASSGLLILSSCSAFDSLFGKKVEKEAVLPLDREQVNTPQALPLYASDSIDNGYVTGDWAIDSVYSHPAIGESAPFLRFAPADKHVYGNDGCNSLSGVYNVNPADSTISFSNMAATMRACAKEGITDYEIGHALEATRYYSWTKGENEYRLYFYDASKNKVMSLTHQNFDFLNGTWSVTMIDSTPNNNPDVRLVIDVDEHRLHGNTGCNIINGSFETDMNTPNAISFSALATTRMACPEPESEMRLLVAIENASSARAISPTTVYLFNPSGERVLVLERASDRTPDSNE